MQLDDVPVRRSAEPSAAHGQRICTCDPLGADEAMRRLPDWNEAGDTQAIIDALTQLLPTAMRVASMTSDEAIASIRDLGMLASSLRRHGPEPAEVVPGLESCMLALGRKVDMVPRDTVFHYGVWNPRGPRQRRFTRDSSEDALIEAGRAAAPGIDAAIHSLLRAVEQPLTSRAFVRDCASTLRELHVIIESVALARSSVDPRFFAQVLRPYFAELRLGGKSYAGAAAAPLSVGVIDHLLWSSDCSDQRYREFQADTMSYNVPRWRRLYASTIGQSSLATRLITAFELTDEPGTLYDAGEVVAELLRLLVTFRGRHKVVAERAYNTNIRVFDHGSGGYGSDTLSHLLGLTLTVARRLDALRRARQDTRG